MGLGIEKGIEGGASRGGNRRRGGPALRRNLARSLLRRRDDYGASFCIKFMIGCTSAMGVTQSL
jgi:hypothetical protein